MSVESAHSVGPCTGNSFITKHRGISAAFSRIPSTYCLYAFLARISRTLIIVSKLFVMKVVNLSNRCVKTNIQV